MIWGVIAALCVGTFALKASGPLALGEHQPSSAVVRVISLVAPAVLTGLVVYESLAGTTGGIEVDERLVGVAAAGVAIWLEAPMTAVIVAAAAATALTRLLV